MSLRSRLIVGLLTLATVGLVALAAITYAEQRNFLYNRIDEQAQRQVGAVDHLISDRFGPLRGADGDGGPPGDGGGPGGDQQGTWLFARSASGGTATFSNFYNTNNVKPPALPAKLTVGHAFTIRSNGTPYRVYAQPLRTAAGTAIAAVPLTDTEQTLHRLLLVEGLVIAAILAALAALSWWLVRLGLRPLDRMGDTAGAIAAGELSHRIDEDSPRTEVGRLGLALNRMLDRLEEAFAEREASEERLRRFLADASHELRTPLASIRGYAELFRIGAAREPAETEKAMHRIEAEAARMGVLVEDLLTLARLDEVRDPVRAPVDMTRLAGDAVDDARATDPDRVVELETDGPAVVSGDAHQLRQVLGNLLRNALVHTPPGTPIDVRVGRDAGHAVLEVRDHGPGLPTQDGHVIFERFWRAEAGRERGRAGAGLGLAIVAAVVGAHGGSVRAENAPDGGARFVVRLPAAAGSDAGGRAVARQPEADARQLL